MNFPEIRGIPFPNHHSEDSVDGVGSMQDFLDFPKVAKMLGKGTHPKINLPTCSV